MTTWDTFAFHQRPYPRKRVTLSVRVKSLPLVHLLSSIPFYHLSTSVPRYSGTQLSVLRQSHALTGAISFNSSIFFCQDNPPHRQIQMRVFRLRGIIKCVKCDTLFHFPFEFSFPTWFFCHGAFHFFFFVSFFGFDTLIHFHRAAGLCLRRTCVQTPQV